MALFPALNSAGCNARHRILYSTPLAHMELQFNALRILWVLCNRVVSDFGAIGSQGECTKSKGSHRALQLNLQLNPAGQFANTLQYPSLTNCAGESACTPSDHKRAGQVLLHCAAPKNVHTAMHVLRE